MRNKDLFQDKLNQLVSKIKLIGYHIHRDERKDAYDIVESTLKRIEDIQTLLNTETQD